LAVASNGRRNGLCPTLTARRREVKWTLIGTRRNSIVSDLLCQRTGQRIGFFDFTPIAATVFVGCATHFFLVGRRLLPKAEARSLEQELGKEYL
jgi:hypothetical protein